MGRPVNARAIGRGGANPFPACADNHILPQSCCRTPLSVSVSHTRPPTHPTTAQIASAAHRSLSGPGDRPGARCSSAHLCPRRHFATHRTRHCRPRTAVDHRWHAAASREPHGRTARTNRTDARSRNRSLPYMLRCERTPVSRDAVIAQSLSLSASSRPRTQGPSRGRAVSSGSTAVTQPSSIALRVVQEAPLSARRTARPQTSAVHSAAHGAER